MKTLQIYLFVAFFLLGLIMITGCSQIEGPTASKETQASAGEQSLQKANDDDVKGTLFTALVDLSAGILNAETCLEVFPDGSVKFNDCELAGPVTGDLEGTATLILTGKQDAVGDGRFRATFTMDVSMGDLSGTFEGRVKGKFTAGIAEGKLKARGTGGFEGMKMRATGLEQGDPPGNLVIKVTGRIFEDDDGDDDDDD